MLVLTIDQILMSLISFSLSEATDESLKLVNWMCVWEYPFSQNRSQYYTIIVNDSTTTCK